MKADRPEPICYLAQGLRRKLQTRYAICGAYGADHPPVTGDVDRTVDEAGISLLAHNLCTIRLAAIGRIGRLVRGLGVVGGFTVFGVICRLDQRLTLQPLVEGLGNSGLVL